MLLATNQIPYDWWAAYHECLGTLRPFTEGVSRNYSPKRIWSFVEWMRTRWDPKSIADEPALYAVTVYLIQESPAAEGTLDLTPRRCRSFRPAPGSRASWTVRDAAGREIQSGSAIADRWGLLTVEGLRIGQDRRTLEIRSAP
jgi:hypothetical protein